MIQCKYISLSCGVRRDMKSLKLTIENQGVELGRE